MGPLEGLVPAGERMVLPVGLGVQPVGPVEGMASAGEPAVQPVEGLVPAAQRMVPPVASAVEGMAVLPAAA